MPWHFEHFIPYFFGLNFAMYELLNGMANSVDPDQTTLFAYATESDSLVYESLGHLL